MVGILIMMHAPLGQAFMDTLTHVYKSTPEQVCVVDVLPDQNTDEVAHQADQALRELDKGAGVLVMVDICGATPANCAVKLLSAHPEMQLVYGASLPALLRAVCYRQLPLNDLVAKVIEGGQRGVYVHTEQTANSCPSC